MKSSSKFVAFILFLGLLLCLWVFKQGHDRDREHAEAMRNSWVIISNTNDSQNRMIEDCKLKARGSYGLLEADTAATKYVGVVVSRDINLVVISSNAKQVEDFEFFRTDLGGYIGSKPPKALERSQVLACVYSAETEKYLGKYFSSDGEWKSHKY